MDANRAVATNERLRAFSDTTACDCVICWALDAQMRYPRLPWHGFP